MRCISTRAGRCFVVLLHCIYPVLTVIPICIACTKLNFLLCSKENLIFPKGNIRRFCRPSELSFYLKPLTTLLFQKRIVCDVFSWKVHMLCENSLFNLTTRQFFVRSISCFSTLAMTEAAKNDRKEKNQSNMKIIMILSSQHTKSPSNDIVFIFWTIFLNQNILIDGCRWQQHLHKTIEGKEKSQNLQPRFKFSYT